MASTNNPTQGQETTQGTRTRSQSEGNGGRSGGQRSESGERSNERQSGRGARALSTPRSGHDLVSGGVGNPVELLWRLSNEMDRMMSSFAGSLWRPSSRSLFRTGREDNWPTPTFWSPHIDVEQRGDSIVVRADLPGVRKEDIQIDVTDEGLTIAGERREEREEGEDDQGYRAIERSYGSFYRTIPLPQKVNVEKLTAKMRDGVLITIPLDESARPKRIQIQD